MAIISFLVSLLIDQRAWKAFFMGFLGVGLCWLIAALLHDITNDHILSTRMASLFSLPGYGFFIVVTVFIGGLIGGLSAWSASLFRKKRIITA